MSNMELFSNDFENNYWQMLEIRYNGSASSFGSKEQVFKKRLHNTYNDPLTALAHKFYLIGAGKLRLPNYHYRRKVI